MLRKLIVAFLGHVDHGKTSIQDSIRESTVVEREAGKITQHVGASVVPAETINRLCGSLLEKANIKITIPGFLMVDTPGHKAFTNLRKRGGSIADIAVLVIDIKEGLMPQTIESIEILKQLKTPFIIAANKIDLIQGYRPDPAKGIIQNISLQDAHVQGIIEKKSYELVGKMSEFGLNAERFDRVDDYTKQIAIVPTSAATKEGIPELLMVLAGLAQRYLESCLECEVKGFGKGTILEVKEEKGLGTTIDVILFNGTLNVNDTIVVGTLDEPVITKIRALLEPNPLSEMIDRKSKFRHVRSIAAAAGVKISSQGFEGAIAGMPVRACSPEKAEQMKDEMKKEIQDVLIETDREGVIVKADTLGSLEALVKMLKDLGVKIKKASIGNITKKDFADAEANYEKEPMMSVILAFNVCCDMKEKPDKVSVIINTVIYKILEDFEEWQKDQLRKGEAAKLDVLARPFKLEFLKNYVFRQSNPAIIGVEVIGGTVKSGRAVMKENGKPVSRIKAMQHEKVSIKEAAKGMQVAVSLDKVTVGRQVKEGDYFYSDIAEEDFRKLKKLGKYLTDDEKRILKKIAEIKRENNPVWGV